MARRVETGDPTPVFSSATLPLLLEMIPVQRIAEAVVGTANQARISGAPVKGPLFDFAPIIDQFLQTYLFGDIFERDNLDWQSRELATVGALAATPGVESQLRQLTRVLVEHGDADAAKRVHEALDTYLAETPRR